MLLAETVLPFLSTSARSDFSRHSRFGVSTLNSLNGLQCVSVFVPICRPSSVTVRFLYTVVGSRNASIRAISTASIWRLKEHTR